MRGKFRKSRKPAGKSGKPRTKENLLRDREITALLGLRKDEFEDFAFRVLLYTGLRVSEFVHMRRSWVDLGAGVITVPERQRCSCMECRYAGREFWTPKTAASARTIPIVPEVRGVLRDFFRDHEAVLEVFPSRQYVNNALKRLGRRAGVRLFPHALRGTFATMLAERGFTPFEIKDALGWASIDVAVEYIKLSGSTLKRAFEEKWHGEYL